MDLLRIPLPVLFVLLLTFSSAAGQQPGPAPMGAGDYKILVVSAPRCADKGLAVLKNAPLSARKLANTFRTLRYEVTHLEDENATAAVVLDWLKKNADPTQSKLVLLVLAGHGCQRDGADWFLTVEATQTQGGLALAQVDALGKKNRWPLVVIMDSCRNAPAKEPAKPVARVAPAPLSRLLRGDGILRADQGDASNRTRLSSVRSGKQAPDDKDLISALAEGLEIDPRFKKFRADVWFQVPGPRREAAEAQLSLRDWLFYGMTRYMAKQDLEQQPDLLLGSPSLSTPLAQADPPGPPVQAPRFLGRAAGALSLLPRWRPQHGAYESDPIHGESAWVIRVPADGAGREPWRSGFNHQEGEGYPVQNKDGPLALFVELLAHYSPLEPFPTPTVNIGLDAKFVSRTRDLWISSDGKKSHRVIPTGKPTWAKIDLKPGSVLNYFGISDIPGGCVITVRQVWLAPATVKVTNDADRAVDLLARWWCGDRGQARPQALAFSFVPVPGGRVLCVEAGPGWMGGVLNPVWVSEDQEVELRVENRSNRKVQFLFEVKEDYSQLGAKTLVVEPGMNTLRFRIHSVSGLANYAAISKPTGQLHIHSIVLKPGPINVVDRE